MNIEQAYIQYDDIEKIAKIIKKRISGNLPNLVLDKELEEFDAYDTLLADNPKRKVALSVLKNGWIAIIESREVNDNALLLYISKELNTDVFSVIQSDSTGI